MSVHLFLGILARLNCLTFEVFSVLSSPCNRQVCYLFSLAYPQLLRIGLLLPHLFALCQSRVQKHSAETGRVSSSQRRSTKRNAISPVLRHARLPNLDVVALTTAAFTAVTVGLPSWEYIYKTVQPSPKVKALHTYIYCNFFYPLYLLAFSAFNHVA